MIFSEKEAAWTKYSQSVNVEDIFTGMVGSVEDYGAFIHLRFPDGITISNLYTFIFLLYFLFYKNVI